MNDHLPGFGRIVQIVRNKSGKSASYRTKFKHIDTCRLHVGQIIGEYEVKLVKESKATKEKVKIVCTDEKPIRIDYNINKEISMTDLKYNLFNRYGQLHYF